MGRAGNSGDEADRQASELANGLVVEMGKSVIRDDGPSTSGTTRGVVLLLASGELRIHHHV
jgi:hypothetical protein